MQKPAISAANAADMFMFQRIAFWTAAAANLVLSQWTLCCRVRRARSDGKNPKSCDDTFERLITEGVDADDLYHEVTHQVGYAHVF
jgi:hypothetical protein